MLRGFLAARVGREPWAEEEEGGGGRGKGQRERGGRRDEEGGGLSHCPPTWDFNE